MLLPDVLIVIRKSFLLPKASICLENIYLKPKSLPIEVNTEVSVLKAIAEIGFLSSLNLTTNSAAICCESAADPPLPQVKIFPPF